MLQRSARVIDPEIWAACGHSLEPESDSDGSPPLPSLVPLAESRGLEMLNDNDAASAVERRVVGYLTRTRPLPPRRNLCQSQSNWLGPECTCSSEHVHVPCGLAWVCPLHCWECSESHRQGEPVEEHPPHWCYCRTAAGRSFFSYD